MRMPTEVWAMTEVPANFITPDGGHVVQRSGPVLRCFETLLVTDSALGAVLPEGH